MSLKYNEQEIKALYYGDDEIVRRIINETVVYEKNKEPIDHRFRFKNVSGASNMLKMTKTTNAPIITLERSSNGVDYEPCDIYVGIDLQPDEVVYLRGSNNTISTAIYTYNQFSSTGDIECHGSIMDLCDDGIGTTTIKNEYQFAKLFQGCKSLITPPELPATTISGGCYYELFQGCKSLTSTPKLPAMQLANQCYSYMFDHCSSLTSTPKLPAMQLANLCYSSMFRGCESLTTAPELPATELTLACYSNMFFGCSSLVAEIELPATTLAENCYMEMFINCLKLDYIKVSALSWNNSSRWLSGVSPTGTFYKPKELTNIPIDSPNGIPKGWKVVDI